MHNNYQDIRDKIQEEPQWFDEYAVPRYCKFSPEKTANIYAKACCLLLIECQDCAHQFKVCMSLSNDMTLRKLVETDEIHYGDPPNACPPNCAAGSTMNSIPRQILEYWEQGKGFQWVRVTELEREITCEGAENG